MKKASEQKGSMFFDYFSANEQEQYLFLQLPLMFIKDSQFRGLSDGAKILYSLLLNRTSLSAKNGWADENGHVYIIYTVEEIMEDMNCWREKATRLMNELREAGLVKSVRRGLGKPNLIYVMNFATSFKYRPKSGKYPEKPINTEKFENRTTDNSVTELHEVLKIEPQEVPEPNPIYIDLIKKDFKDIDLNEREGKAAPARSEDGVESSVKGETAPAQYASIPVEMPSADACENTQPDAQSDRLASPGEGKRQDEAVQNAHGSSVTGGEAARRITFAAEKLETAACAAQPGARLDKLAVPAPRVYRDVEKLPAVNACGGFMPGALVNEPVEKIYGYFKRVRLSDEGYNALVVEFGAEKVSDYIDRLDSHIASKGKDKEFVNHQATIRGWINKDANKRPDAMPDARVGRVAKPNRFVNFKQRDWDYAALEKLEREHIRNELEKTGFKIGA